MTKSGNIPMKRVTTEDRKGPYVKMCEEKGKNHMWRKGIKPYVDICEEKEKSYVNICEEKEKTICEENWKRRGWFRSSSNTSPFHQMSVRANDQIDKKRHIHVEWNIENLSTTIYDVPSNSMNANCCVNRTFNTGSSRWHVLDIDPVYGHSL